MNVKRYLIGIASLALLVPLHELLHAGTCLALGGVVHHINFSSHMVCGGTVNHMAMYGALSSLNDAGTASLFAVQFGRLHGPRLALPIMSQMPRFARAAPVLS